MQIAQELVFEFARLGLVYVHLIACCVAIGLVAKSDVSMIKAMLKDDGGAADRAHMQQMKELQWIVSLALGVLWASGVALVTLDALTKGGGWLYFSNPKMQAKILVVVLLTLNGLALHSLVLPALQKAGSILKLDFGKTVLASFTGVVSAVSWMYAAFMGIGRPLAWKYSLLQLMAAYPLLIVGGFMTMLLVLTWCSHRHQPARAGMGGYGPTPVAS
jgi:hypothetical protein